MVLVPYRSDLGASAMSDRCRCCRCSSISYARYAPSSRLGIDIDLTSQRRQDRCGTVLVTRILTATITCYQKILSPLLGPRCRFYPSCSQFAKECLETYTLPIAVRRISGRLLSCHPFHPGGIDLP